MLRILGPLEWPYCQDISECVLFKETRGGKEEARSVGDHVSNSIMLWERQQSTGFPGISQVDLIEEICRSHIELSPGLRLILRSILPVSSTKVFAFRGAKI